MANTRREDRQRAAALHLYHRGRHPVRQVSRILGIPKSTVHDWVRQSAPGIRNPRLRIIAQHAIDQRLLQGTEERWRILADSILAEGGEEELLALQATALFADRKGNPQALRDWFNNGAGGKISWGSAGDFDACVRIAGKFLDNPQGFCNERHQDATGKAPGKEMAETPVAVDQDDDDAPSGAMVAFFLPADAAAALAINPDDVEGEALPPGELHLTLAYLGDAAQLPDPDRLRRVVAGFAAIAPPVEGEVSGVGRFATGDRPVYASYDAPELPDWRHRLVQHLRLAGYPPDASHGFTPHVTLAYPTGKVQLDVAPLPLRFGTLTLALGAERYDWPLEGNPALFAELPGAKDRPPAPPKPREDAPGGRFEPEFQDPDSPTGPWPGEPTGVGPAGEVDVVDPEDQDVPPPIMDRLWLQAFKRWTEGISNDVAHHRALASAKQIDPDFTITDRQARRAYRALGKLDEPILWSERRRLELAQAGRTPPPGYVQAVMEKFRYSEEQQQELADYLTSLAQEGYLEGINAQLTRLNQPLATSITDPTVLQELRDDATRTAAGIADTYDRDLASQVYQQWIDLRAERGSQMSRYWLEQAIEQWAAGRADWKARQITATELNRWWNRGTIDFGTRNAARGLKVLKAYVTPDECACARCKELVDGNPYDMDEVMQLDLPLHPSCCHFVDYVWEDVSSGELDFGLWTGQDEEAA